MGWHILGPLERDGESRRSGGRKWRWIGPYRASGGLQSRVNSRLHQDVLHVPSDRIGRHRQFGSQIPGAAPECERSSSTRFSSSVSSSVPSVSSARLLGRSMRSNGLARKGSARRVARAPGAPDLTTSGLVARAGCVR